MYWTWHFPSIICYNSHTNAFEVVICHNPDFTDETKTKTGDLSLAHRVGGNRTRIQDA